MSAYFMIDDVRKVEFKTQPHTIGKGGRLAIKVVSQEIVLDRESTSEVCLVAWTSRSWDLLRDIERAAAKVGEPSESDVSEVLPGDPAEGEVPTLSELAELLDYFGCDCEGTCGVNPQLLRSAAKCRYAQAKDYAAALRAMTVSDFIRNAARR